METAMEIIKTTFEPVRAVLGIILSAIAIFMYVIMRGLEKRVMDKIAEHEGWLTRHNRINDATEKRIDNIEKETYGNFNLISLCKERDQSHRDLCDERHKK